MDENRLAVNIEHEGLIISAYLTCEGLVVDVIGKVDGEEEIVATGYEFFSEAGLEPPQRIEEEEVGYTSSQRYQEDLSNDDLFECSGCQGVLDIENSVKVDKELYCPECAEKKEKEVS